MTRPPSETAEHDRLKIQPVTPRDNGTGVRGVIFQIIDEVDRIDAHDHTKRSLKKFINETCLAAGITIVDRRERVLFARRLLDDGEPRPTIRDRLMVRFSIKRATAYTVIGRALKLSSRKGKI